MDGKHTKLKITLQQAINPIKFEIKNFVNYLPNIFFVVYDLYYIAITFRLIFVSMSHRFHLSLILYIHVSLSISINLLHEVCV